MVGALGHGHRRGWGAVVAAMALAGGAVVVPMASTASAASVTVDCDDGDLQGALDDADPGDVITIEEGDVCHGHFDLPSTHITLVGAGTGASFDGGKEQILAGHDVQGTVIRQLTFHGGYSDEGPGAAISIDGESSPVLDRLVFFDNLDDSDDGGAVYIDQSSEGDEPVVVEHSIFGNADDPNEADGDGGALYVNANNGVVLTDNAFIGNESGGDGGGAKINSSDTVTATGNTFSDNFAGDNGGGIDINAEETVLTDNRFIHNEADSEDGGGADVQGGDGGGTATIRGNTFGQNYADESGGGLFVEVDDATVSGNHFALNHAESFGGSDSGGGLAILVPSDETATISGNDFSENDTPTEGGGAFIDLDRNATAVVSSNRFEKNESGQRGGGAAVVALDDATLELNGNTFLQNQVAVESCVEGFETGGGGLSVVADLRRQTLAVDLADNGQPLVSQNGNDFDGNVVRPVGCEQLVDSVSASAVYQGELHGGGEMLIGVDVQSVDDELLRNRVTNAEGDNVQGAEGGGISMRGDVFSDSQYVFSAENLVLAGNVLQGNGEGAGAYFGGGTVIDITIGNATVVANQGRSGGAGLGGGDQDDDVDHLVLTNSIVYGNTASAAGGANVDVAGFDTTAISFSDVCTTGLTLEAGSGNNSCTDPKLVDAAGGNVHQTSASPTLDAGSNALVPSTITGDYEGQPRIQDAARDGSAIVDMGADELPTPPPPAPKPPEVAAGNLTAPGAIGEDDGYCLSAKDGGVFTFGGCQFFGAADGGHRTLFERLRAAVTDITAPQSLVKLNAPIVSIAMIPADTGYWQAGEDGGVFSFGTAQFHGSMGSTPLSKPIVGIASSPTGNGYWLVASDGGVFSFGDAPFFGSTGAIKLTKPIVGITATPSGQGYWLVASDGGVFSFGDAQFFGSTGDLKLNAPIVGMGARPGGLGYWLAASDGGVFTFGDAPFLGNRVGQPLNAPVIGIKSAASGNGYWLIAGDGGVFSFGSAPFLGSTGSMKLNQPVIDMTG